MGSFKVDEDLSEDIADVLRAAGYDAMTVLQQCWQGREDSILWRDLQAEKRTMVTADKGFSRLAANPPHHGVILLRPDRESRAAFLRLIQTAIDSHMLHDLANTLMVITESRIRVRKMGI